MAKSTCKILGVRIIFIIVAGVFLSWPLAHAENDDISSTSTKSWYWYLGQKLQEEETSSVTKDNVIEITVHKFPEPTITEVDGYHHVEMKDIGSMGNPGEPVLPVKGVNVLIPPGKEIKDSEVVLGEKVTLPGTYIVEPGQEPVPLSYEGEVEKTLPKDEIYNSTSPFPQEVIKKVTIQNMLGYKIATFILHPVEYIPKDGILSYYENMSFKVDLEGEEGIKPEEKTMEETGKVPTKKPKVRNLPSDREKVEEFIANPQDISSYEALPGESETQVLGGKDTSTLQPSSAEASGSGGGEMLVNPAESYQYVVITNEYLKNAPDPYNFQALCAEKEKRGITTKIVTTEWIYANYDGTRPDGKEDNATKIRNFIIDAYNNWETEYILLGGDATGNTLNKEIIPVRKLYDDPAPGSGYATTIPSDLYYSCLDGTMDKNGNGIYGDPYDETDLLSEIFLGRAPVATQDEVSNFVRKTLKYKTTSSNYILNTYQVGEWLSSTGTVKFATEYLEEIRLGSSAHGYTTKGFRSMPSLKLNTLYDTDNGSYYAGDYTEWPPEELIDIINNEGVHILNHLGHSDIDYNMKLSISDVDGLANTQYFFGYSQGCLPAAFDKDCIVEHFVKDPSGAFAFVANSRYGWGSKYSTAGASQYYAREFWDAVFGEGKLRLGEANQDSKQDNLWSIDYPCHRWCYLELNLFGDPELALRLKTNEVETNEVSIEFNKDIYSTPSQAEIFLSDSALSDKVIVDVVSLTETTPEKVTLTKTEPGVFKGLIQLQLGTAIPHDGILQVSEDDEIKVIYHKKSSGDVKEATAKVDIPVTLVAPNADFIASPINGITPLKVDFADTSKGNINNRLWNFGDGATSGQQNPSHTYNTPGTYTVSLTVTGPGGNSTETKENYVNVLCPAPVANFTGTPKNGVAPLEVNFTDISTGTINSWLWNFGNGVTSTKRNPNYIYNTPGAYTVTLTVTGPGGSYAETKANYINVSHPAPVANFTVSTQNGVAPLEVNFTNISNGTITSYLWNFGDGVTSTERNPNHTYNNAGTYTVSLTVTGPGGNSTATKENYVTVSNPVPKTDFIADKVEDKKNEEEENRSSTEPTKNVADLEQNSNQTNPSSETESAPSTANNNVNVSESGDKDSGGNNIETNEGCATVTHPAPAVANLIPENTAVHSTTVNSSNKPTDEINSSDRNLGNNLENTEQISPYYLYNFLYDLHNLQLAHRSMTEPPINGQETESISTPAIKLKTETESLTTTEPTESPAPVTTDEIVNDPEPLSDTESSDSSIIVTYEFIEPTITEVDDYHHVEIEGIDSIGNPGEPVLPVKGVDVLIPGGKKIKNSEVILGEKITLPDTYFVEAGGEPMPLTDKIEKTMPKDEIYKSNNPFPPEIKKEITIQEMRGYRIAVFNLFPVEYIPKDGKLSYYESITLKVNLEGEEENRIKIRNLPEDKEKIRQLVVNPQDISSYDTLME